jgi:hypothetical protein
MPIERSQGGPRIAFVASPELLAVLEELVRRAGTTRA